MSKMMMMMIISKVNHKAIVIIDDENLSVKLENSNVNVASLL